MKGNVQVETNDKLFQLQKQCDNFHIPIVREEKYWSLNLIIDRISWHFWWKKFRKKKQLLGDKQSSIEK